MLFATTCAAGFYAPDFPTLAMKPPGMPGFLSPDLATDAIFSKSGYTFRMAASGADGEFEGEQSGSPPTCNGLDEGEAGFDYAVVADPIDPVQNASRFFGTNADGVIYEHTASLAAVMPGTGAPAIGTPIQ
jgi:hypothetical protein